MTRYLNYFYSLLFGIAVALFFGITYKYHLHYHEQFQLFVFEWDYLWEKAKIPGGFAGWLGRFFTQFYYISWLGAAVIALLLVGLQLLVNGVSSSFKKNPMLYPLSFLPSIAFWVILCDENYLLGGLMGLMLIMAAVRLLFYIKIKHIRLAYVLLFIPLLYWACGGSFVLFVVLALLAEVFCFKQMNKIEYAGLIVGSVALSWLFPYLADQWLQYPVQRLHWGVEIHRVMAHVPKELLWFWGFALFVPLFYRFIPAMKKTLIVNILLFVAVSLTGGYYVKKSVSTDKENVMAFDYFVREAKWDEAIALGRTVKLNSFISISAVNLSLAMKNELADDAFLYGQYGMGGLVPQFARDYTSTLSLAEIYYQLGIANIGQRFYFEAMEAIPDRQKSGRALKRLAETNIINGQYEVAARYLYHLEKSLFYRKWAKDAYSYLYDEEKINAHPEWGRFRQLKCNDNGLVYTSQAMVLLGQHLNCCPNKMTFDYATVLILLDKGINEFYEVLQHYGPKFYQDRLPIAYQEALLIWAQAYQVDIADLDWKIDTEVLSRFNDYIRILEKSTNRQKDLANYRNTYWYYNQFGVIPKN